MIQKALWDPAAPEVSITNINYFMVNVWKSQFTRGTS